MDSAYPDLVTEIHRYSEPTDMFAFHSIVPDTTGSWNIQPFTVDYDMDGYDEDSPTYREDGITTRGLREVEDYRGVLWDQGYRRQEFIDNLPDHFRDFVIHRQCPLEWQLRMESDDQELCDRVVVWVRGELPAQVPA